MKTVKPLFATKSDNVMNGIILIDNDPGNVSNIMNEFYVKITRSIDNDDSISINGQFQDIITAHTRHPSALCIKESIQYDRHFSFSHVNFENVCNKQAD